MSNLTNRLIDLTNMIQRGWNFRLKWKIKRFLDLILGTAKWNVNN